MTADYPAVRRSLICEFDHYDLCLSGLCEIDGKRYVCKIRPDYEEQITPTYDLLPVVFDAECEEYLEDYRAAYGHWFYTDGRRVEYAGLGTEMAKFIDKWQRRNPILEKAGK